ncbi:MAG: 6,7-dimethyl-8-ribityllumazine synthase [Candidatus Gracilibacteria bacterium]
MNYGIVVSEFNPEITEPLLAECLRGFKEQNIEAIVIRVPGAFEIPLAVKVFIEAKKPLAVVALGAVIKGETDHYEQVSNACTQGIMRVSLDTSTPVIFEVLMADSVEKAMARVSKGYSASLVATQMARLKESFSL